MSVSKIAKVQLTVVQDHYGDVMDVLQAGGFMEVEEGVSSEKSEQSKAAYWYSNVEFAIDLLKEYAPEEKKSFKEKLAAEKPVVSDADLKKLEKNFNYKQLVKDLENLDKEANRIKNTVSSLKKELKNLSGWKGAPVVAETETRFVKFLAASVPVARCDAFREEIKKVTHAQVTQIGERGQFVRIIIAYTYDAAEEVEGLFDIHEVKEAEGIIGFDESVSERCDKLEKEIAKLNEEFTRITDRIAEYSVDLPKFEMLADYLTWKKEQEEISRFAIASQETHTHIGWIQKDHIAPLKEKLDTITTQYHLEELEIGEDDEIPIVLRNSSFIEPFESVTEVYGAPQYKEPDPTILLAPFFLTYFALCLTDAGYGVLLALLSFVALKLMKPKGGAKKLITLMIFGGIATFVAGALFGGWFGIVLDDLPAGPIKDAMLAVRLIDPVANPMGVLVLSFILGFIQMVVANVIDAVWKIRQGMAMEGILGSGVWALFLMIIGFWVAGVAGVLPEGLASLSTYLLYAGILMMVVTQGRGQKNIFLKVGMGVFSLYGLVGYLSDILSYSRLLALGLSTGIIASVINLVAALFAGMVPFVGWLVWILIIIGGHLFNLAINVLGAYIHAGRLQFVEYFPKFMEGGGRRFKPMVRTAKYVSVKE